MNNGQPPAEAKTSTALQDMINIPQRAPLPSLARPSKKPLDDNTIQEQLSAKKVDTGENKDPIIEQLTAGTVKCSIQAKSDRALSSRPAKRTMDDAGTAEVPRSKRIDTGNQKGVGLSHKRTLDEADDSDKPPSKSLDTGAAKVVTLTRALPQSFSIQNNLMRASTAAPDLTSGGLSNRSKTAASSMPKLTTCVCCGEISQASNVCRGTCNHEYCKDCLQTVVRHAFIDEALFPPRCCKLPFSMDNMRRFLSPELISQFYELKEEFETPNRTYCWNSKCSTFLYPDNILRDEGVCPKCFNVTCTICKGQEHEGDCPEDEGIQQVIDLAAKEGWRRCDRCLRLIEFETRV
jgi:hypothetical protein